MEHIVYFYIIFFIYTLIISFSANQLVQKYTLSISCIILCIIIGFRDIYYWNDAISYTHSFEFYTPTIFDSLSFKDIDKLCYNEKGFFLLSSLIKTISSDVTTYFTIIAAFSIFFLYKNLNKYCIYPLIGLCIYISRFMIFRETSQIRAAIAINLFLLGLYFIQEKQIKKYLIISTLSFFLHTSLIFAVPLYFICNKLNIEKKHIIVGIILALAVSYFFSNFIKDNLGNLSDNYGIAQSYLSQTKSVSSYYEGQGIANPMIYYQVVILLFFTLFEDKLIQYVNYYYIIRTAYFYSTLLLIVFSSLSTFSGRTSTIFATLEIVIIPSFLEVVPNKKRFIGALIILIIYSIFFFLNIARVSR